MPWAVVNKAITGATFEYVVSPECVAEWNGRANSHWRNEDDPDFKDVPCPACSTAVSVPWTTCGLPRDYEGTK